MFKSNVQVVVPSAATHTPTPWRASVKRVGALGMPEADFAPIPFIGTDFHAAGKIRNGSEAELAVMSFDVTAWNIGGQSFSHTVTFDEAQANAARIVKCVNAHDALVASLYVLTRTPAIRAFLGETDPKALRQATDALAAAGENRD
jgi:hypothetical protein